MGSVHPDVLHGLREELSQIREYRGISAVFENWHGRLAIALKEITADRPDCAETCRELRDLDFEMPIGLQQSFPEFPGTYHGHLGLVSCLRNI